MSSSSDEIFPKKWEKKLPDNYKESTESKSNDEILQEILKATGVQSDLEKDMEQDAKLNSLKEDVKALAGGYKEMIGTEKAKINYCLYLLRARGAR